MVRGTGAPEDNPMISLLSTEAAAELDVHASQLVDDNNLESGWFLRGVSDALEGVARASDPDNLYRRFYNAGYDGIVDARSKVEV